MSQINILEEKNWTEAKESSSTDHVPNSNTLSEEKWDGCEDSQQDDIDLEREFLLHGLQKAQVTRQNKTFRDDKLRDIERTNMILMQKILSHNKRPAEYTTRPSNFKVAPSTLTRKRQQEKIDHDNLILLRKIQTVKPCVTRKP